MQNPSCGTDPGLPAALAAHLSDLFGRACQLTSLTTALEHLLEAENGRHFSAGLASVALDFCLEIERGLEPGLLEEVAA